MGVLENVAESIIKEQERVIGPLAWSEAEKVSGLQVSPEHHVVIGGSDQKAAIDGLVARYERLFGKASHKVCIEAAASLIRGMAASEVPVSLVA